MDTHFVLYATENGILALRDPIRIRIMHFIETKEREFDEIVGYIGKAKSTVSEHLDKLDKYGIISIEKDPKDLRKKRYSMKAKVIAMSSKSNPFIYIIEPKYFRGVDGKPFQ